MSLVWYCQFDVSPVNYTDSYVSVCGIGHVEPRFPWPALPDPRPSFYGMARCLTLHLSTCFLFVNDILEPP